MHRASPVAPPVEPRGGAPVPPSGSTEVVPRAPKEAELALSTRMWSVRADVLMVGFWALVATVLGRGLAPALPGSTAGIGPLIVGVEQLGAFASQFMAVMGVATCIRLLLATIECRSYLFRPVAIITCAAALPIIISSSSRHLAPAWLMALMALSAALALVASLPVLRAEHSRAAGLVLLTVTCGSIVSAAGRIIAIYASHHVHASLFSLARGIATAGLLLDTISVVLVAFWLARRWRYGIVLVVALWSAAAVTAWSGTQPHGATSLVVERALTALTAHPDPFIGSGFRYFVELCAILFGAVTLWFQAPTAMGAALCFALLARVSGDVPLCALMLILAALSAVRASLQSVRPDAPSEPSGRRAPLEVMPATR